MTTTDNLDTLLNALIAATADYCAGRVGGSESVREAKTAIRAEFERLQRLYDAASGETWRRLRSQRAMTDCLSRENGGRQDADGNV